jgi:hypothetical protein
MRAEKQKKKKKKKKKKTKEGGEKVVRVPSTEGAKKIAQT